MDNTDGKLVFFHGLSQDEAVQAMRAVKVALGDSTKLAFAMSTPSNLHWQVEELIEHVLEEHRAMNDSGKKPSGPD